MSEAPVFSYSPERIKELAVLSVNSLEARLRALCAIPAQEKTFKKL